LIQYLEHDVFVYFVLGIILVALCATDKTVLLVYWCHGRRSVVVFFSRNEVLRRFVLIGYLGCMFVLLIGPTGFGCAMTTSCVKGAVLVDWVQGFCCVRKEGRAKGPCLHCFVAGDVNSGSGKVRLSGGHLTNFVTHERSRSLNQSLNNTPHRTLYGLCFRHRYGNSGPTLSWN
jgi:hypothetical protein